MLSLSTDRVMGWLTEESFFDFRYKHIFLFSEGSSTPLGLIQPLFNVYRYPPPGGEDVKLTTHLLMFLRLRTNGGVTQLCLDSAVFCCISKH